MGSHLWLTVPMVVFCITLSLVNADLDLAKDKLLVKLNDTDIKIDKDIPLATNPRFNKMLPEGQNTLEHQEDNTNRTTTSPVTPTTTKDEIDTNYKDTITDEYYYDDYDEDDEDEAESLLRKLPKDWMETMDKQTTNTTEKKDEQLKPIEQKEEKKPTTIQPNKPTKNTVIYEDNIEDEEEILYNKNVPCPDDCQCTKNINGYLIATCTRLDASRKFGSDITDLEVLNVSPKYPIVLGAGFFKSIGLNRVSSIKIVNSHIEYIHPSAFEGLNQLYSVNLTNSGIDKIHPDTFADNKKLRLLTLAGNDLHQMQQKAIPFLDYMLNAPSVEELDISQCKLNRLLPTAFTHLKNIVYINLADNQLRTLPLGIFEKVETLEEIDLSSNSIEDLPKNIFNGTSLSILNMKYNEIQSKVDFVPSDMQKLDLSYNKITFINNIMFQHLKSLTSLILKGNAIRKIHETAFYSLKDLRHIDLSFNDLEQISSLIFLGNIYLDVIRLNDNPRLKKLPLDGFESRIGIFNVYFFDVSNCDLNELGENTFSTMPHLSTLNLAWNNIEIISKGLFTFQSRLIELDISNNLVTNLDELTFLHNSYMKKLSLAGNPLQQLSIKTFLPTTLLSELDLSDCDLSSIWTDTAPVIREVNLKNLKILNLANNDIEHIHTVDFEPMKSLSILDIDNNKIHCDDEFRNVMKLLNKKKVKVSNVRHDRDNAELNDSVFVYEIVQDRTWDDVARDVCKKDAENFKPAKDVIDTEFDSDDDSDDDDDEVDGNEKGEVDDLNDSDDNDESNYNDEYDEDDSIETTLPSGVKKGTISDEMKIIKSMEDEEELILERRPFIYYGQYRYLMPILIIVFGVLAILLLIGKIVSLLMRRRGERYRQALLASKNSIVYQKLSEDIYGPATPKFNRFAPINQV